MTVYNETAGVTCQEMTPAEKISVPRLYRLGDLLHDFEEDATAAHESYTTGKPRGPITGFTGIDEAAGGCLFPGTHVLHGDTGAGKTAFGLQIAACCGCPAMFISCEMPPLELLRRLAARVTGTYLGRFKTGELQPAAALALARKACEAAPDLAIVDGLAGFPDQAWLFQRATEMRGTARHILLVIDSLHSWAQGAGADASEYECLAAALASLRTLAGQLQAPVLMIVEENRPTLTKSTKRGLHSGAGHRGIEYGAESVLGMTCEDEQPDMSGEKRIVMKIEKNRHGKAGDSFNLLFHGALQRYREGGA